MWNIIKFILYIGVVIAAFKIGEGITIYAGDILKLAIDSFISKLLN